MAVKRGCGEPAWFIQPPLALPITITSPPRRPDARALRVATCYASATLTESPMTFLLLLAAWIAGGATMDRQPAPPPDTSGYVWDGACKDCHRAIHAAWARTKHATAINRLTAAERERECVRCHVTGAPALLAGDGGALNAGVQCESCHGPGRDHAKAAASGSPTPLPNKPDPTTCEGCHNGRSPHFRGFFYSAMAPLVHKVK